MTLLSDAEDQPAVTRESESGSPLRMRTALIVYNPISSSGNSAELAQRFSESLRGQGITCQALESERKMKGYRRMREDIASADLLIVIGGDGTVRKLLRTVSRTRTPIYVVPAGNESLISKSLQTSADPRALLAAVNGGRCVDRYFGLIGGEPIKGRKPFFIMASMGLDSLTVKRIGQRTGPVNDFVYAWHAAIALASLHHPTVTLTVDGRPVVERAQGYVIVANSSAYTKNLAIVPAADPAVPSLTLGFLPGAGRRHELIKGLKILQRKPAGLPLRYFSGKTIELDLHHPPYPLQVDGDWFRDRDLEKGARIRFSINPDPVSVLIPPRLPVVE